MIHEFTIGFAAGAFVTLGLYFAHKAFSTWLWRKNLIVGTRVKTYIEGKKVFGKIIKHQPDAWVIAYEDEDNLLHTTQRKEKDLYEIR